MARSKFESPFLCLSVPLSGSYLRNVPSTALKGTQVSHPSASLQGTTYGRTIPSRFRRRQKRVNYTLSRSVSGKTTLPLLSATFAPSAFQ